jgi:hypothetical protein
MFKAVFSIEMLATCSRIRSFARMFSGSYTYRSQLGDPGLLYKCVGSHFGLLKAADGK